jgi:hypothetical protein
MLVFDREFEDTKGVIRIRKSKKDTQHNRQAKKNNQQSTKHTHKTKYPATRTPLPPLFFYYNIRDLHLISIMRKHQIILILYRTTIFSIFISQNSQKFY